MKNKEIEKILFDMDLIANHDKVPIYFTQDKVKLLLSYIEQLEKDNEKLHKQVTEYQDEIFARDNNWYDMQD